MLKGNQEVLKGNDKALRGKEGRLKCDKCVKRWRKELKIHRTALEGDEAVKSEGVSLKGNVEASNSYGETSKGDGKAVND